MNNENTASYRDLGWILNHSNGGFFSLIASPKMQEEVIDHYSYGNLAVYDYREHEKHYLFEEIARWLESEPDRAAYALLHFELALWEEADVKRLNFSRDMLARTGKNFIFCMTAAADDKLNRGAMDFYDYIKLSMRFEDELPEEEPEPERQPIDRSTGLKLPEIDFSWPERKLLALAISLSNQAEDLRKAFRYRDALAALEQAREIRERVLGKDHPDTASVYFDIGYVYYGMGDYAAALEWYHKALAIYEKVLGKEHPYTAATYHNIGLVYDDMGEYTAALDWYHKALAIREKVLGKEHPSTAATYNNIAAVYEAMGDTPVANIYWRKAEQARKSQ